ncbi:MAG: type II toxin-antitoxin system RelE/ParE family toxin [Acidobacteriaceae bacterium]
MQIQWSANAAAQLHAAHEYVAEDNRDAAQQQSSAVIRAVEQLAQFPEMGRPGRVAGTRELVVQGTPLLVAYTVGRDRISVLAVLHGARRWPLRFAR